MGVIHKDNELFVQVQKELEQMQPYVQSHGGEIELISVQDYTVAIRLKGACDTCPLSFYTITFGLEKRLQNTINLEMRVVVQD